MMLQGSYTAFDIAIRRGGYERRAKAGEQENSRDFPQTAPRLIRSLCLRKGRCATGRYSQHLNDRIGAISLVEVTMHSLESREIGNPEQEVLKRTQRSR
jgi:hypothetical protein